MQPITYARKRDVFKHLGDPDHWESRYSEADYTDKNLIWTRQSSGHITARFREDNREVEVRHDNGSVLHIRKNNLGTRIEDESGAVVTARGSRIEGRGDADVQIKNISYSIESELALSEVEKIALGDFGLYVGFNVDTGEKIVLLDNHSGAEVTFPKAVTPDFITPPRFGFLHAAVFDRADWNGSDFHDIHRAAVLVAAFDVGLESGLRVANAPSLEKLLAQWAASNQIPDKPKLALQSAQRVEISWSDTAEFSGWNWNSPKQFRVAARDDGFELGAELDQKDGMISAAIMLQHAEGVSSGDRLGYKPDRDHPGTILDLLGRGAVVSNHRGEDWCYVVVGSENAGKTAANIRTVMNNGFGLDYRQFSAVSFERGHTMFAMDCGVRDGVAGQARKIIDGRQSMDREMSTIYEALSELEIAIRTGNTLGETSAAFISSRFAAAALVLRDEDGITPRGEEIVRSMETAQRYELLSAVRDLGALE